MFPSNFEYRRANSVQEAVALLGQNPDAKLIAGGHSLLPAMKLRLATPPMLIDISKINDLKGIRQSGDVWTIGALATHAEVAASALPMGAVKDAASQIGDVQVRNMGTIGGSISHADPAADYPAALLVLNTTILAQGPKGSREIPIDNFFTDLFTTALQPNEILVGVRIGPPPAGKLKSAYAKHPHPASGFAVVGVAARVATDAGGKVTTASVAVTGACARAQHLAATEKALMGKPFNADTIKAASAADNKLDCLSDQYAGADYRAHLASVLARQALTTTMERMK